MQSDLLSIQKFFTSACVGRALSFGSNYLHEMGHAVACKLLYSNSSAQITMKGLLWLNSHCNCRHFGQLTQLGAALGNNYSRALLSAGGPIADIFITLQSYVFISSTGLLSKRNCAALFIPEVTRLFLSTLLDSGDYKKVYFYGGAVPYTVLVISANLLAFTIAKNAFSNIPWGKVKIVYDQIIQKKKKQAITTLAKTCSFQPLARRFSAFSVRANPFLNFFSLLNFINGKATPF